MSAGDARLATVAGAVLTGGGSSRMGRDKAGVEIGGVACAVRVARVLDGLFSEVLLVGGDPPADAPGRRVPDPEGATCALRGLACALGAATAERVFVAATDMPFLSPDLVLALVAWPEADAVVPRTARGVHPLCGVYRSERVLPVARAHLEAGRLSMRELLAAVETAHLEPDDLRAVDPTGSALTNVNTPDDLRAADAFLAGA